MFSEYLLACIAKSIMNASFCGTQTRRTLIRSSTHLKHLKLQFICTELNQGTDHYGTFGQRNFLCITQKIKNNSVPKTVKFSAEK